MGNRKGETKRREEKGESRGGEKEGWIESTCAAQTLVKWGERARRFSKLAPKERNIWRSQCIEFAVQ